jgi:hypothetical protein
MRPLFSSPTFRRQSGLEMLGINTCLGSLRLSHLRSLWAVDLYELGLGWTSSEGEEPRALSDVSTDRLGPDLRLLRLSLLFRFFDYPCFLCFHFAFLLGTQFNIAYCYSISK